MRYSKLRAFTLIELLVVISIITLVMSISLPAINRARESGRRTACKANLRSIGQAIFIYAHNNDDLLFPGNGLPDWSVQKGGVDTVNLGYLIDSGTIPTPSSSKSVLFCPSSREPDGSKPIESFRYCWDNNEAGGIWTPISYMFNTSLDGYGYDEIWGVQDVPILSHNDKINFLKGDGSVHTFDVKRLIFDPNFGPERLHEVAARYGLCYPTVMLHAWLERGEVDTQEAMAFLNDPRVWEGQCVPEIAENKHTKVSLSDCSQRSLVCDTVGAWGQAGNDPSLPISVGGT